MLIGVLLCTAERSSLN